MTAAADSLPAGFPEWRQGPPWVMAEMIAAQPGVARRILQDRSGQARLADLVRAAVAAGERIALVGCGTSEHAAMAIALELGWALPGASRLLVPRQALEAALDPWKGLCLAVSHEGETAAAVAALRSAAELGAATALITAVPTSTAGRAAGHLCVTPLVDRSWCHTVGYLSPLLVGAGLASQLGGPRAEANTVGGFLERCLERMGAQAEAAAVQLSSSRDVTCVGGGGDYVGARELALKLAEGSRVAGLSHQLETVLHGHLAALDGRSALVLVLADPKDGPRRLGRAGQVLAAAERVGAATAVISGPWVPSSLPTPAVRTVRIDIPASPGLGEPLVALLGSAVALQLLAVSSATARGTCPDLIRREEAAYREAAALTEGEFSL